MFFPIGDDNRDRIRTPWAVWVVIGINAVVWLLQLTIGEPFTYGFSVVPYEIVNGVDLAQAVRVDAGGGQVLAIPQYPGPAPIYLTLLSAMFMHGSWMHIIGNMVYLLIFGDQIEDRLGHVKFLVFYLLCGLLASAAHIAVGADSPIPSLGASGAIAGVLGAYLVLHPTNRVNVVVFYSIVALPAFVVLGGWILLQLVSQVTVVSGAGGGVAYMAHIGGFVAGVGLIFLFGGRKPPRRSDRDRDGGRPRARDGERRVIVFRSLALPFLLPLAAAAALTGGTGCAGFDPGTLDEMLGAGAESRESRTARGLREALTIGAQRAADRLSRPGGFLDDARLRIPLPDKLERAGTALRAIGLGAQVDELETAMNRAAERAAGASVPIFRDAVASLTLDDAIDILRGGDTAATDALRLRTEDRLRARFLPEIESRMREVDVYSRYEILLERYERIPFAEKPSLDLKEYVADETLDGLFDALAAEETRIRRDPVARTTALLREVFGG